MSPDRRQLASAEDVLDTAAHRGERDAERLECPRGHALALVDQAEEDVLGAYLVVVEPPRFLLSQHDHATGPISEPLEHGHSIRARLRR